MEPVNAIHYESFGRLVKEVNVYNPWFTEEFVLKALEGICLMLERNNLEKWLAGYPDLNQSGPSPLKIGVVMAGNIPLVGFHDFLCVLLSGNTIIGKPASRDEHLIKALTNVLLTIDPDLTENIEFTEDHFSDMDAVIATGSNNTSRYFEYYFRNIPGIIRKNRNSIAVLNGKESDAYLAELGRDIFTYFGLGCRNVTKLYIPEDFDIKRIMQLYESYNYLYDHHKYANNIDYYRTIYLMNRISFYDNGAVILKEDAGIASPVGVVYYEKYADIDRVRHLIEELKDRLQCIVSVDPHIPGSIIPGTTQSVMPWDYADGVDTLRFLIEIRNRHAISVQSNI